MGQLKIAPPLEAKRLYKAEKVFAVLLLIYPASHRRQFAAELQQTFRDLYRDYSQANGSPVIFWSCVVLDITHSATREYISLIRSPQLMKINIKNTASTKALIWGIALITPIPLSVLAVMVSENLRLRLLNDASLNNVSFVIQIVLPIIALVINLVALLQSSHAKTLPFTSWTGVKHYFWTIVLILVVLAWVAFIFAPLTFQ